MHINELARILPAELDWPDGLPGIVELVYRDGRDSFCAVVRQGERYRLFRPDGGEGDKLETRGLPDLEVTDEGWQLETKAASYCLRQMSTGPSYIIRKTDGRQYRPLVVCDPCAFLYVTHAPRSLTIYRRLLTLVGGPVDLFESLFRPVANVTAVTAAVLVAAVFPAESIEEDLAKRYSDVVDDLVGRIAEICEYADEDSECAAPRLPRDLLSSTQLLTAEMFSYRNCSDLARASSADYQSLVLQLQGLVVDILRKVAM